MSDDFNPQQFTQSLLGGQASTASGDSVQPAEDMDPQQFTRSLLGSAPKSETQTKLEQAHSYYSENAEKFWGPGSGAYLAERIPGANIGVSLGRYANLSKALNNVKSGEYSDDDLFTIAQHKARSDYEANQSFSQNAMNEVTKVPALAAEFAMSGGLAGGIKVAGAKAASRLVGEGLASKAAGYGAGLAAQTALTPSLYIDKAVNNNMEKDRDPLDPRGLPQAFGLALAQNAVLGEVGKITGKVFAGSGLKQVAGRIATQAVTGPFAQAATDMVTYGAGLSTGYGTVEQLLKKNAKGEWDPDARGAMKSAVITALQFGAFGAAHEISHGGQGSEGAPRDYVDKIVDFLKGKSEAGATPQEAADALHQAMSTPPTAESADAFKNAFGVEMPKAPPAEPVQPVGPAAPPPPPRETASALESQLRQAQAELLDAKKNEIRERGNREMGLAHAHETATEVRKETEKRVKALQKQTDAARVAASTDEAAKVAVTPGNAPEASPSPPAAETPKAPPEAAQQAAAVNPEEARAKYQDLVTAREKARAGGDFEAEVATGKEITKLIQDNPGLRETSILAQPRKPIPDTSDLGQQTPQQKLESLNAQLLQARHRLDVAKADEGQAVGSDKATAKAARRGWTDRVKTLQEKADAAQAEIDKSAPKPSYLEKMRARQAKEKPPEGTQYAGEEGGARTAAEAKPGRPMTEIEKARAESDAVARNLDILRKGDVTTHEAAGLTKEESDAHFALTLEGKTTRQVGEETGVSHETIRQRGIEANRKLGIWKRDEQGNVLIGQPMTPADIGKDHAIAVVAEAAKNGLKLDPRNVEDNPRGAARRVEQEADRLDRHAELWAEYLQRREDSAAYRNLNAEQRDALDASDTARYLKGDEPPANAGSKYKARQTRNAKKRPVEAPVQPGDSGELQADSGERPANAPGEGGQGAGSGTGGPADAAGSELGDSHEERQTVQDIQGAGYPKSEAPGLLEQARRIAQDEVAAESGTPGPISQSDSGAGRPTSGPGSPPVDQSASRTIESDTPIGGAFRRAIDGFAADEAGSLDLDKIKEFAGQTKDKFLAGVRAVSLATRNLGHEMFPATHDVSQELGNKTSTFATSRQQANRARPYFIDKVLGEHVTEAQAKTWWTTLQESRLRYAAADAKARGDTEAEQRASRSFVGAKGSALTDEAAYLATLKDPEFLKAVENYKNEFVPIAEQYYKEAAGIDPADSIDSLTQIPGLPVPFKAIREGDTGGASLGSAKGSLNAQKLRKLGATKEAKFSAEKYETDFREMLGHIIESRIETANKHEMFRTAVAEDQAHWDHKGPERVTTADGQVRRLMPNVEPPKGTQENARGQNSLYVNEKIFEEIKNALNMNEPGSTTRMLRKVADKFNALNLLVSTGEFLYHGTNQASAFFTKPGMRYSDLFSNIKESYNGNTEFKKKMMDIARLGSDKPSYSEKGNDSILKYGSKMLDGLSDVMRATAHDAYQRLAKEARAGNIQFDDTPAAERNFINQLGKYERRSQAGAIQWLRDSGVGPFATAGSNYIEQGVRSIGMDPGIKGQGIYSKLYLRANFLKNLTVAAGAVAAMNYFRWGRVDGDDKTPFGNIKLWEDENGSHSIDVSAPFLIKRGLRTVGLLSMIEGQRGATPTATNIDKATEDMIHAFLHPAMGPAAQTALIAAKGYNTIGMRVAEKAKEGESQMTRNLKAAALNVNPILAEVAGAARPDDKRPIGERLSDLAGPYGIKTRKGTVGNHPHK